MSDKRMSKCERRPVRSAPGLIIVGPERNQQACNAEALQILSYPNPPSGETRLGMLLKNTIASLFKQQSGTDADYAMAEFISGRRHYRCTRYVLNVQGLPAAKTVVTLLERTGSPAVTVQEVCFGLNMSHREREAVGWLARGLTSKEIAQHMGISPNTVKSFLRLVMTKAGVSTRTGLIGRVTGITSRQPSMSAAAGKGENTIRGLGAPIADERYTKPPH